MLLLKLKSFKFLRKLAELERLTDWAPDKSLGLVSAQVGKEYNLDNWSVLVFVSAQVGKEYKLDNWSVLVFVSAQVGKEYKLNNWSVLVFVSAQVGKEYKLDNSDQSFFWHQLKWDKIHDQKCFHRIVMTLKWYYWSAQHWQTSKLLNLIKESCKVSSQRKLREI